MDIFCGSSQNGLVLGVISMHFRVFSYGQCTERGYCFGLLKFQIFVWVVLIFQIIFWE